MDGVTDPNDMLVLGLDGLDDGREFRADSLGGHSRDEGNAAGNVVGVEGVQDLEDVLGTGLVADFDSQRVLQSTDELEVGKSRLPGSFTDPQQVCRCVVVLPGGRVDAGHGFLVGKQQALVCRVEINLLHGGRIQIDADGVHETKGFFDDGSQLSVLGSGGCCFDEIKGPGVEAGEVSVSTAGKGTQDVEGLGALVVGLNHSLGVGLSGFGREGVFPVDVVSLIRRKGHAVDGFRGA
mmetsp:Transcript_9179/g.19255  ORF Transcript_9179/g.19255 Transcript_9179/m.19255 type:complete len:237 (+) Transcript_9179:588-1298(+)